jgi:hypothetical protein
MPMKSFHFDIPLNFRACLAGLLVLFFLLESPLSAQPRIGYVLPSGGQQGTTVEVLVAGKQIRRATGAIISGEGVEVKIAENYPPIRNFMGEQRILLRQSLADAVVKLQGEAAVPKNWFPTEKQLEQVRTSEVELPEHPMLRNLENATREDVQRIVYEFITPRERYRPSVTIREPVLLEVTIASDAAPGNRELRLLTPAGPTPPVCFQVGIDPEVLELEPNGPKFSLGIPLPVKENPVLQPPVVINGQIQPGDVDYFRIEAKEGQQLVMAAMARRLVPFLADAVPGWFEAMITVYDLKGNKLKHSDCYGFQPDPVLFYRIPETGTYVVEIRDSLYRGREDFVYRLSIAEEPFVTAIFPPGGTLNESTEAWLSGGNLPTRKVRLDTEAKDQFLPAGAELRTIDSLAGKWLRHPITYAVNSLPEGKEQEPNDHLQHAQIIEAPVILNGMIEKPGDRDVFQIQGKKGDKLVLDVNARVLNSPLDSYLHVYDAQGNRLFKHDDPTHLSPKTPRLPMIGLKTHFADSYLMMEFPHDGPFYVQLGDLCNAGGKNYTYRLRVSPPQPRFTVYATPAEYRVVPGGSVPLEIFIKREDGFQGEITLHAKEPTQGFSVKHGDIPPDRERDACSIKVPKELPKKPVFLKLEARGEVNGKTYRQEVIPVTDWEQAFLYHHLVPAESFLLMPR